MYIQLDEQVAAILRCPLCKDEVLREGYAYRCGACGTQYPVRRAGGEDSADRVYDFRVHHPTFCVPAGWEKWREVQSDYERRKGVDAADNVERYRAEVDSVREVYREEYHLSGRILDVGGNNGRLRHYLDDDTELYVSVDPFIDVFHHLHRVRPHMRRVYSCLEEPCNFVACHAEFLPFEKASFDWVHMRSVIDHFADPYLATTEAYRVLRKDGRILIGTSLKGNAGASGEAGKKRTRATVSMKRMRKVVRKVLVGEALDNGTAHMTHWNYENLLDLLRACHFEVEKVHWQKPPYNQCVYVSAVKR